MISTTEIFVQTKLGVVIKTKKSRQTPLFPVACSFFTAGNNGTTNETGEFIL
jgi:hypothetical protein